MIQTRRKRRTRRRRRGSSSRSGSSSSARTAAVARTEDCGSFLVAKTNYLTNHDIDPKKETGVMKSE